MSVRSQESYADLVAARAPALLRLAYLLTGNVTDAEDLLQSTLARIQPHSARIPDLAAPTAYLRKAMLNPHFDAVRTAKRRPTVVAAEREPAVLPRPRPVLRPRPPPAPAPRRHCAGA